MSVSEDAAIPMPVVADFQLLADIRPEGEADAFIPIRWCLSREAVAEMDRREATTAFMVLVVANRRGETDPYWSVTDTKVVKLTAEMTYVRFNSVGLNRVYGSIIWRQDDNQRKLKEAAYEGVRVSSWSGELTHRMDFDKRYEYLGFTAEVDVTVPADMFAPEPPAWAKRLVRTFFNEREVDQCHFRKRFLTSLAYLPVYLVFSTLIRVLYCIAAAFIGLRGVKWIAMVRPFKYDTTDTWRSVRLWETWWNSKMSYGEERNPLWWFLQPISYTVVWAVALFLSSIPIHYTGSKTHTHPLWGWSALTCLWVSILIHVAILLLIGFCVGATALYDMFTSRQRKDNSRKRTQRATSQHQELMTQLFAMACDTSTKRPSLQALPKQKRSIRLRFNGTKKGVCRPYSK